MTVKCTNCDSYMTLVKKQASPLQARPEDELFYRY